MDGSRGFPIHEAVEAITRTVNRANQFIQDSKPWALAKDPAQRPELERVLATLARQLARQAVYLSAIMPGKAEELWRMLGGSGSASGTSVKTAESLDCTGWRVTKGEGLFPRPEPTRKVEGA